MGGTRGELTPESVKVPHVHFFTLVTDCSLPDQQLQLRLVSTFYDIAVQ